MTAPLAILYLAHDLSDPAIHRRVQMLKDGGAAVTVAGFHRTDSPINDISGCPVLPLGRTYNGRFIQRIGAVLRTLLRPSAGIPALAPDVIIARNLEMLAIGVRARSAAPRAPVLVYESLDIHRLLLGRGITARGLRELEGWLSRRASLLVTSSPSFVTQYFTPVSRVRLPVTVCENKIYDAGGALTAAAPARGEGPPWRIGWFGIIRCRKSLALLSSLVRESGGAIEVVIRGRPALDQIPEFHDIVAATPGMRFEGPYSYPADLAAIYGCVHFSWAIDMYEEGLNSSWLLPNRLYEGGMFDAVPIAIEDVATGAYLSQLGLGVTLARPLGTALEKFFARLTPDRYRALSETARNIPRGQWRHTRGDGLRLVSDLRALSQNPVEARKYA